MQLLPGSTHLLLMQPAFRAVFIMPKASWWCIIGLFEMQGWTATLLQLMVAPGAVMFAAHVTAHITCNYQPLQGLVHADCAVLTLSCALHIAGEETLTAAAQHIGSILRQFNQQNLALALWAFAKLGWRPHTSLLSDACRHALLTLDTINPQNLSNILWALATMEFIPPPVLLEVRPLLSPCPDCMTPAGVDIGANGHGLGTTDEPIH